ncbi:hypothetical protein HK405_013231, partial [Cladochytrium tenue]
EYLTGFHKRNVERQRAKEKARLERLRDEKRDSRRNRRQRQSEMFKDVDAIDAIGARTAAGARSRKEGALDDSGAEEEDEADNGPEETIVIPTARKVVTVTVRPVLDDEDPVAAVPSATTATAPSAAAPTAEGLSSAARVASTGHGAKRRGDGAGSMSAKRKGPAAKAKSARRAGSR